MSDTTTTTTATTSPQSTPDETNETAFSWTERVKTEVRQAGEMGKAQWKDAFARTRKLLDEARGHFKREELERVASRVKGEVTQAWSRVPVAKAQARGADLLLRVVTPVRTFATSIEQSLVEARAAKQQAGAPAAA